MSELSQFTPIQEPTIVPASFKNGIINGDMKVAQRGTSSSAAGYRTIDRWTNSTTSSGYLWQEQVAGGPDSQSNTTLRYTVGTADTSIAAGDFAIFQQNIEGFNFNKFVGQIATLSFWVKSDKTGTYHTWLKSDAWVDTYLTAFTIDSSDTWEKKTISVSFANLPNYPTNWDLTNGVGLRVGFTLMSGSNYLTTTLDEWITTNSLYGAGQVNFMDNASNNFSITRVQLELGTAATDYEFMDYQTQLDQCYRYYQKLGAAGNALACQMYQVTGVSFLYQIELPVQMRTTPTATKVGTWTVAGCAQPNVFAIENAQEIFIQATATATGQVTFLCGGTDDYVALDSEL